MINSLVADNLKFFTFILFWKNKNSLENKILYFTNSNYKINNNLNIDFTKFDRKKHKVNHKYTFKMLF